MAKTTRKKATRSTPRKKTAKRKPTRKKKARRSTVARKKTRKKITRKRTTRSKRGGLTGASTNELRAELARRERKIDGVKQKRAKLEARIAELDRQLSSMGASSGGGASVAAAKRGPGRPRGSGGTKRPKNKMTLLQSLAKILNGRILSVSQAVIAVQKAGYRTNSANFNVIVNQALLSNTKTFRKVARGQYTLIKR